MAAMLFFLTLFWQTRLPLCCRYFHVDYAIPFLYLSDCTLLLWVATVLGRSAERRSYLHFHRQKYKIFLPLVFFLFWSTAALTVNSVQSVAFWYRWVKILEGGLVFSLVAWNLKIGKFTRVDLWRWLACGIAPPCLIAVLEVVLGRSLGLQILGEWHFSALTPGIATFSWRGKDWLRPYATFPHPNVLGGVLAILLPQMLFYLYCPFAIRQSKLWSAIARLIGHISRIRPIPVTARFVKRKEIRSILLCFLIFLYAITIFLTFSRTAWITLLLGMFVLGGRKIKEILRGRKLFAIAFALSAVALILIPNPLSERFRSLRTNDILSWQRRWDLTVLAGQLVWQNPLTGAGLNQFPFLVEQAGRISGPSLWAQPVHNIWLLMASETGLVGLTLFIWFILGITKEVEVVKGGKAEGMSRKLILLGLLIPSLLDHYWLTTQQGLLFAAICLGVVFSS